MPTQGKIANFDRKLARNAGLDLQNKILVQFYPASTTARLMQLELEAAKIRGLELVQVRRTLFKIRPGTQGFEYYVAAMEPKIPAAGNLSQPSRY